MDLMSSRFKSLGFRSKNRSPPNPPPSEVNVTPTPNSPPPSGRSSSTTSLPMNNQPQLGRPPSYTMNNRPTSPMVQHGQHQPPPITTNLHYNQPSVPVNGPPGYGMQQQMAPSIPQAMSNNQYQGRNPAVEIEGAGRSNKAQLIVGIDFGTTFSGVAYAFATNNEAREDIITEWPGAGTHTKQKVSAVNKCFP